MDLSETMLEHLEMLSGLATTVDLERPLCALPVPRHIGSEVTYHFSKICSIDLLETAPEHSLIVPDSVSTIFF